MVNVKVYTLQFAMQEFKRLACCFRPAQAVDYPLVANDLQLPVEANSDGRRRRTNQEAEGRARLDAGPVGPKGRDFQEFLVRPGEWEEERRGRKPARHRPCPGRLH